MDEPKSGPPERLVLPSFVKSKEQVHALVREILQIDDFLDKARIRSPGTKMNLPKTTADLDKFAEANKRNVLNREHRRELANFLRDVYNKAPTIGLIYPVDHGTQIVDGVIEWLRDNIHAQVLVAANPQSHLGGGCMLRFKHKTYDFTLKKRFEDATTVLSKELFGNELVGSSSLRRKQYF